jgi:2-iminobutanoate/2-iminopropanoate deaminase
MKTPTKVETKNAPAAVGPYSQAVRVNDMIFVSGQLPVNPKTGQMATREIQAQTEQVITNIEAVLTEAGSSLSRVVRCDVFLTDMADFKAMNGVYAQRFTAEPKPARQAFQVVRLPLDAMIEISCIACAD